MWFKGINNLDLFAGNPQQMLDALVERLGFQRPDIALPIGSLQDDGFYNLPGYGALTGFARLSPWTADYLQIIAMRTLSTDERHAAGQIPLNSIYGVLTGVLPWEGNRPVKTHQVNTSLDDDELLELVRHWDKVGVPYLLTEPYELVPFPSIFPGWDGDPLRFHPEQVIIPWEWGTPGLFQVMQVPELDRWLEMLQQLAAHVPTPPLAGGEPPAGALQRVLARSYLVSNVDETLANLRANMNLVPSPDDIAIETFGAFKRARLRPRDDPNGRPMGAALEFLEPLLDEGRTADFYRTYGPGPFATRLGAGSLQSCCAELDNRGTRWSFVDQETGTDRILVDPSQLCGAQIEIEAF